MHALKTTKQRIVHRLKITKGHLNKIIEMTEDDTYCMDIIHQSQAVQSALKEIDNLILENHLRECVVNQIKDGKINKSIEEIMKAFKNKSIK